MTIEKTTLKALAEKYSYSVSALCLLADLSQILREFDETSKALSQAHRELEALKQAIMT